MRRVAFVLLLLALGAAPGAVLAQNPPPMLSFGDEKPLKPETPAAQPADPASAAPPRRRKVARAQPRQERGVVTDDPRPSFTPESAQLIQGAAERYRQIALAGGWTLLPAGTRLTVGAKGPLVLKLRERLAAEGEIGEDMLGAPVFDAPLAEAVKLFQTRHGLARNGVVAGATLQALNVPAEARANQLQMSAARLSGSSFAFGGRHVVVNLPSASVEAVENGFVKKRYVAVVGKPENASPLIEAKINAVNINPTWTVPVSIVRNEIIPRMRRDPGYLTRSRIRILDGRGGEIAPHEVDWGTGQAVNFTFRQDSGVGNALGQIRIEMPNREAVYMHDTPSKKFFAAQDRFYSHGCVRVQDVKGLAAWLVEDAPGGWDRTLIEAAIATGDRRDIRMPRAVPVAWVYLTGFVTEDGKAHFRDDIYGLDRADAVALPRRAPAAPAGQPVARPSTPTMQQMIDPAPTGSVQRRSGWKWW